MSRISDAHGKAKHLEGPDLYWTETTGKNFDDLPGTAWIRLSTGKLCLDIGNGVTQCNWIRLDLEWDGSAELPSFELTENELHAKLLGVLKLDEFHAMVAFSGQWNFTCNIPSSTESITLPSIWIPYNRGDFQSYQLSKNPFPNHYTSNDIHMGSWNGYRLRSEVMPTGWTRWASELDWGIVLTERQALLRTVRGRIPSRCACRVAGEQLR